MRLSTAESARSAGKSHIAKDLAALGAAVVDADKLGHKAYEPGTESYAAIVKSFGREIIGSDERVDRQKLGAIVFRNASDMKRLTDIVWPAIGALARSEFATLEAAGATVIVRVRVCMSTCLFLL